MSEITVKATSKNKYGQYFTPKIMAEFMVGLADINSSSKILEPACGKGIFLDVLTEKNFLNLTAYEIDKNLLTAYNFVNYQSFVAAEIADTFDLIIGNPPYIRWKNLEQELKSELANNLIWNKYFNSLCDYLYIFILKSIELLNENGQLIFICPEYWLNTTHSLSLRNYMVLNGYFESIYHFNETPIFDKASVSVIVFKYIKSKKKTENIKVTKYFKNKALTAEIMAGIKNNSLKNPYIEYFNVVQFEKNKRWLLTNEDERTQIEKFEKSCVNSQMQQNRLQAINSRYISIGDICDIGNGMVSGCDKVFQLDGQKLKNCEKYKTIKVVKAKDLQPFVYNKITQYIFVNDVKNEDELKASYPSFFSKLSIEKARLNKRYQYNKKINYWEWVFLRNYNLFSKLQPRIFVPSKERISNKNYFRFAFVQERVYPTQDVTAIFPKNSTKESIYYILAFLNNHRVFIWLKNNGIIKGNIVEFSEKPISTIPFRVIDWNKEKIIHDEISELTKQYIKQRNMQILNKIDCLFDELLNN